MEHPDTPTRGVAHAFHKRGRNEEAGRKRKKMLLRTKILCAAAEFMPSTATSLCPCG